MRTKMVAHNPITMPPGKGTLSPVIFTAKIELGDFLEIKFEANGIFFGLPLGDFDSPDLPVYPGIYVTNKYTFISGKSNRADTVVLTFFDSDNGKTYVCILTIA